MGNPCPGGSEPSPPVITFIYLCFNLLLGLGIKERDLFGPTDLTGYVGNFWPGSKPSRVIILIRFRLWSGDNRRPGHHQITMVVIDCHPASCTSTITSPSTYFVIYIVRSFICIFWLWNGIHKHENLCRMWETVRFARHCQPPTKMPSHGREASARLAVWGKLTGAASRSCFQWVLLITI